MAPPGASSLYSCSADDDNVSKSFPHHALIKSDAFQSEILSKPLTVSGSRPRLAAVHVVMGCAPSGPRSKATR